MSAKLKFNAAAPSTFSMIAKQRVNAYFQQNNLSKNANGSMWFKTAFFLSGFVGLYLLIILGSFDLGTKALFAALLGMFSAFIGFNICHDAMHGSMSANHTVNKVFSFLFNLIGANPYVWNITHNVVHHSYTNIYGHDEDIDIAPGLIRLSEEEKLNKIHKYQHMYFFAVYSLATLSWVFRKDYKKFFQKKIGQHPNTHHPAKEYFNLFFNKALYYALFLLLPYLLLDITVWQLLAGFLIMHLVEGLLFGLVFQLAHVVEGTLFTVPDENGNMEDAWVEHQLKTTANFATGNSWIRFFYGGLNFQIEHHLFPKICHIHYPAISGIVRQTATEFNLPYIENITFFGALKSHYRILKKLGKEAIGQHTATGSSVLN